VVRRRIKALSVKYVNQFGIARLDSDAIIELTALPKYYSFSHRNKVEISKEISKKKFFKEFKPFLLQNST
jgi:hypothetical protein